MTIRTTAKESFDLYEGIVEDTADPKKGQRVKVRVVGVHEYEGEGENKVGVPPTEDLPCCDDAHHPFGWGFYTSFLS